MAKKIITKTAPILQGQPEVNFRGDDFDTLIYQQGYEVIHERAVKCPCQSENGGGNLISCKNCLGIGWVFLNSTKDRMVLQSINSSVKYQGWSMEDRGKIKITSRNQFKLAFMDRITLQEGYAIYSQILFPKLYENTFFAFTTYPVKSVESLFLFDGDSEPLILLEDGVDYTSSGNKIIILNDELRSIANITLSATYKHQLQYHIIDISNDVRNTRRIVETKNGSQQMPVHAIGEKAHYIMDASNLSSPSVKDNTYH